MPITRIGITDASSVMMSKPPEPDEGIEDPDAVRAYLVLELGHRTWGEHTRHEAAVHAVQRRVLEHDHAAGELDRRRG